VAIAEELPKLTEKGRDRVSSQVQVARMIGKLAAGQAGKRLGSLFDSAAPKTSASSAGGPSAADATGATAAANGRTAPPPSTQESASRTPETSASAADSLASDLLASDLAATEILGIIEGEPGTGATPEAALATAPAPAASVPPRAAGRKRAATRAPAASRAPGKADGSAKRRPAASTVPDVTALPIPGYDTLAASQVVQRLGSLRPDELDLVRRYEVATRGRRTILHRIGQLSSSDGRATG
jgi:hypothetical protein